MKTSFFSRFIIKPFLVLILVLAFLCTLPYLTTTIYDFPETKPFSGDHFYNPYENLGDSVYKANFHAHSSAWSNVTNGHSTEKDIYEGYKAKGYSAIGISNYHSISTYTKDKADVYIPVYEHGLNLMKSHFLAINAKEVSFFDYPIFQTTSHRQSIINNISESGSLVCLAHPDFTFGHSSGDMEHLVNYEFTEVLNQYRVSEKQWDTALSCGKLTWIMANDDTHDIVNEPTYLIWNFIHPTEKTSESFLEALEMGRSYGVKSYKGEYDNHLKSVEFISDNTVQFEFATVVNNMYFYGQNGEEKKISWASNIGTYTFAPEDNYIRVVARDESTQIYLNPIVRYDGKNLVMAKDLKATVNHWQTWIFRIAVGLLAFGILLILRKRVKRRK